MYFKCCSNRLNYSLIQAGPKSETTSTAKVFTKVLLFSNIVIIIRHKLLSLESIWKVIY